MKLSRRRLLHSLTVAAGLPALPRIVRAAGYPARPVHIVIGFNAGGAPDVVIRLLSQWLSEKTGQNFIVDNRPGAGGNIATETVLRAPADGYTLIELGSPNFINATLSPDPNFDLIRDVIPVAGIGRNPFVMVVNPDFPAKTVPEFIAYAKANPGKINMTSTGTGNLTHFSGELFKMLAGVDMVHVPGHGEMAAQTDLLAGRVQVMFDPIVSTLGYVQTGKLRALGVTTATRIGTLPDVPTIAQFVPGYEVDAQLGIGAAKGTPTEIVEYLNGQINAALADPAIKERLVGLGFVPLPVSQTVFGQYMKDETEKWAKVVKFAGIKLE